MEQVQTGTHTHTPITSIKLICLWFPRDGKIILASHLFIRALIRILSKEKKDLAGLRKGQGHLITSRFVHLTYVFVEGNILLNLEHKS